MGAATYPPSLSPAISASATAIAKPMALKMFPLAEITRAVPTSGETAIMTPWMSSAVIPLSAAAARLAR